MHPLQSGPPWFEQYYVPICVNDGIGWEIVCQIVCDALLGSTRWGSEPGLAPTSILFLLLVHTCF